MIRRLIVLGAFLMCCMVFVTMIEAKPRPKPEGDANMFNMTLPNTETIQKFFSDIESKVKELQPQFDAILQKTKETFDEIKQNLTKNGE